jgi:hypothetical protein
MTFQNIVANSNPILQTNENFDAVAAAGTYGKRAPATTGLTWAYYGGRGFGNTIADGTVSLTASATNYVVASRSTGAVSVSTATTNWNDTTNYFRVRLIVAGASTITTDTDYRELAGGGSGGAFTGGTLTSALNEAPPVTIASAATVNIGAAAANTVIVSGTTTITAIDAIAAGAIRRVRFLGALTLTHNATSLILPAAANIATAAGDVATMESLGSGNWRCVGYARADGTALVGGGGSGTVTSVDASGGVETTSGSPITGSGTVRAATLVNAQTGASYTYVTGDRGKLVTHSNASAIAGTLPQAVSTFGAGWFMRVKNKGAGTLTITPTTSTIDGASTLVLTTGQWALIVSDGTNYQSTTYAPAGGGGGGLANFTESANSASPNGTVPVMRLAVNNAASDVDLAWTIKGLGSILAALPDGTATGGNKRGFNVVDLQLNRSAAADVASGNYSGILSGRYNKASGRAAVVPGGEGNVASGDYATAAGSYNTASGNSSTAFGDSNTASGTNATAIGSTNTANAPNSTIVGGIQGTVRGINGMWAYSAGQFTAAGDAQVGRYVSRVATSSATPADATTNAGPVSTNNAAILPNNSVFAFDGTVVAKVATFGDRASYKISGQISRGANAAATQIDGTPTVTTIAAIGGATAWVVAVSADTGNGGLKVTVTGAASTNIKWVADIRTVEVVG